MNAENFVEFSKRFIQLYNLYKIDPDSVHDLYSIELDEERHKKTNDGFYKHGLVLVKNAKVFEIDDSQKKLLALSDPPKHNEDIKLPFEYVFLDVSFTKEELESHGIVFPKEYDDMEKIIGIGLNRGNLTDIKTEQMVGEAIRFTICMKDERGYQFNTFTGFYDLSVDYDECNIENQDTTPRPVKKFLYRFFLSFLNFLNNPEVEYVEHKRSEKNIERKWRQGKIAVPSTMTIHITGKVKRYIDEIRHGDGWHLNHRFWVRGHYKRLQSDRYIEKKTIWIMPFVKGKGKLINKIYQMEVKDEK